MSVIEEHLEWLRLWLQLFVTFLRIRLFGLVDCQICLFQNHDASKNRIQKKKEKKENTAVAYLVNTWGMGRYGIKNEKLLLAFNLGHFIKRWKCCVDVKII